MGTTVRAQWWLRTRCELGGGSSARRVLIVRTGLRTSVGNLAPTGDIRVMLAAIKDDPVLDHLSRALGCVRILREDVREGSFGDRWEWSPLVVTANGHWLDAWLEAGLRLMLAGRRDANSAFRLPTSNATRSCGCLASTIKNLYCPVTFAARHGV